MYTCVSCHVIFANSDLHRQHYKSDWHRYNLKRKIAELAPVTADEFEKRVASQKHIEKGEIKHLYCTFCRKTFSSENALSSHLKSKKHIELMKKHPEVLDDIKVKNSKNFEKIRNIPPVIVTTNDASGIVSEEDIEDLEEDDDSDWESCDEEDEPAGIEVTECLFCLHKSDALDNNVEHMVTVHSFFIPDIEYLTDLTGLITYLGEKVGIGHTCLWCCDQGKSFHSTKAVQQHMLDKGHCKMHHEGEHLFEYSNFYDYSSSYPEDKMENEVCPDDEVDIQQLETDNWELVLPSGATIGHRSLARYYRQNLPPEKAERSNALQRLMAKYKALGWTGLTGEQAMQKARDIKFMQKVQSKQQLRLGVKNNRFQPHFRPQVMF